MLKLISGFFQRRKGVAEYSKLLMAAVADKKIDDNEKRMLDEKVKEFGLQPHHLVGPKSAAVRFLFETISADKSISNEEKEQFNAVVNYFDLPADKLDYDKEKFTKYRILDDLSKGILPTYISSDFNILMKPGEEFHFLGAGGLMKRKNVTKQIKYAGSTHSIRITKGWHYRTGSIQVASIKEEVVSSEDVGIIWLTKERIGFKGSRKNIEVPFKKISFFEITDGMLAIGKSGKETPYLIWMADYDVALSVLDVIVNLRSDI
jgi:hypothetical protein